MITWKLFLGSRHIHQVKTSPLFQPMQNDWAACSFHRSSVECNSHRCPPHNQTSRISSKVLGMSWQLCAKNLRSSCQKSRPHTLWVPPPVKLFSRHVLSHPRSELFQELSQQAECHDRGRAYGPGVTLTWLNDASARPSRLKHIPEINSKQINTDIQIRKHLKHHEMKVQTLSVGRNYPVWLKATQKICRIWQARGPHSDSSAQCWGTLTPKRYRPRITEQIASSEDAFTTDKHLMTIEPIPDMAKATFSNRSPA